MVSYIAPIVADTACTLPLGVLNVLSSLRLTLPVLTIFFTICHRLSSSSSFHWNQATWPVDTQTREIHTDRQIDSISNKMLSYRRETALQGAL